jgi:hypothetical protein
MDWTDRHPGIKLLDVMRILHTIQEESDNFDKHIFPAITHTVFVH